MPSKMVLMSLALALIAEVLASVAVWHGTPTDWPEGGLYLWRYEALRLGYWSLCCAPAAAGLWAWHHVASRSFSNRHALALFFTAMIGVEAATSVLFWRSLTVPQVGYLGWPDLQRYTIEHFISWVASVAGLGLVARLLLLRRLPRTGE